MSKRTDAVLIGAAVAIVLHLLSYLHIPFIGFFSVLIGGFTAGYITKMGVGKGAINGLLAGLLAGIVTGIIAIYIIFTTPLPPNLLEMLPPEISSEEFIRSYYMFAVIFNLLFGALFGILLGLIGGLIGGAVAGKEETMLKQ